MWKLYEFEDYNRQEKERESTKRGNEGLDERLRKGYEIYVIDVVHLHCRGLEWMYLLTCSSLLTDNL